MTPFTSSAPGGSAAGLGQSFSQTANSLAYNANGQPTNPVADAIKILSFKMPSIVGASAPAATALLRGSGSGGIGGPFGSLIQQWLGRVLQGYTSAPTPPGSVTRPFGPGATVAPILPSPTSPIGSFPQPSPAAPPQYTTPPISTPPTPWHPPTPSVTVGNSPSGGGFLPGVGAGGFGPGRQA